MPVLSNTIVPNNLLTATSTNTLTNKTISGTTNTITNVSLTTGVTGILPAANGGTGVSSYTAGDLLYATAATTISKLGVGATNTVLTSSGSAPQWSTTLSVQGATVVSNSSGDAVRITQTGTGNALVVEDSANPDSTPFVINSSGQLIVGRTIPTSTLYDPQTTIQRSPQVQVNGSASPNAGFAAISWDPSAAGAYYAPALFLARSLSATIGTQSAVTNGTPLGSVLFSGDDGTSFVGGASIQAYVDGTPGTNDMPSRLIFSTTSDGGSTPTERVRIDSLGRFTFGSGGASTGYNIRAVSNITGAASAGGMIVDGAIQSDVTSNAYSYRTYLSTAASAFTLNTAVHFYAAGGDAAALGSGSAITNQYGFRAESTLTGASSNFGFYSNITSGTGRWNFYANGSADNYLGGSLALGGTTTPGAQGLSLRVGLPMTGVSNEWVGILNNGQVRSGVTSLAYMYRSVLDTQAAAFTLANFNHYHASQSAIGAGSAVTNQYGFIVDSSLTGATNNYGFYSSIASGTGRWNFYANGSADNYFAGSTGVGTTAAAWAKLHVGGTYPSSTNYSVANYVNGVVPSTSTTEGAGFWSELNTQAATFSTTISHFVANQGTFGAGSTVTSQHGFRVASNLTGATNNYGFLSNIASGTGRWNFYAQGTAANYFAGTVTIAATTASTSTTTGALIVGGGVGIAGALNATTKSFIIDHPTKPGKLLKHGSLEGPEFGVYVRGRLNNTNMIVLPEYWTKLVDPSTITVNLTPIGSHQELYVENIVNNVVFVKNSNLFNKTINCFYTVFGERMDVAKLEVEGI